MTFFKFKTSTDELKKTGEVTTAKSGKQVASAEAGDGGQLVVDDSKKLKACIESFAGVKQFLILGGGGAAERTAANAMQFFISHNQPLGGLGLQRPGELPETGQPCQPAAGTRRPERL